MFSKACEYGIRATIYIALQSLQGKRVRLKDIAHKIDSPVAFTAKILQQLAKNNILDSVTGPLGGFEIEKKKMNTVKLSNIVSAIDGEGIYRGCALGLKECNENQPCPVHNQFKIIRNELKEMLESTSIRDLALGLKDGGTFLKR